MAYEQCVIGADGRRTRWSHDHDEPVTSEDRCDRHGLILDCCGCRRCRDEADR